MLKSNVIGIDLAKSILQICQISRHGELISNKAVNRQKLKELLATVKLAWLIQLRERLGINRACIALANKTVRTAWAMLRYETKYQ